jgi:hypothetical protein
MKNESDPAGIPAGQLAKFGVGYLASAAAAAELREMSGVGDDGGQSEPEDDPADGESPDAESGS